MKFAPSLTALCLIFSGTCCIQWTDLQDGLHVYSCAGSDVSLPWTFTLGHGESITSIQWFFNGRSQEMVAFFSHGSFVPLPDFSHRVEHSTNGGLILRHVTTSASGNYTVEVNGADASGVLFTQRHTVHVQVSDGLMTSDGQHHMTQSPRSVYNDVTGQWSIQLTCGNFSYQGQPPFPLEWVTPSGRRSDSTGYHDNHFYFLVPNPAENGRYICRVPDNWTSQACLSAGHPREAYLTLDSVDVRLMLMEAKLKRLTQNVTEVQKENQRLTQNVTAVQQENQRLTQNVTEVQQENQRLTQNVTEVQQENQHLTQNVTAVQQENQRLTQNVTAVQQENQRLTQNVTDLQQENQQLKTDFQHLMQRVSTFDAKVQAMISKQVSFHAKLPPFPAHLQEGDTLILTQVYSNHGDAYDNTTGVFTAPYNGTYFFIASIGSYNSTTDAQIQLMKEGLRLCLTYAHRPNPYSEVATCHAVMHLTPGQRVWLQSYHESYYHSYDTFFSGFLVSSSPL